MVECKEFRDEILLVLLNTNFKFEFLNFFKIFFRFTDWREIYFISL